MMQPTMSPDLIQKVKKILLHPDTAVRNASHMIPAKYGRKMRRIIRRKNRKEGPQ